jgi:hypothetical protein
MGNLLFNRYRTNAKPAKGGLTTKTSKEPPVSLSQNKNMPLSLRRNRGFYKMNPNQDGGLKVATT